MNQSTSQQRTYFNILEWWGQSSDLTPARNPKNDQKRAEDSASQFNRTGAAGVPNQDVGSG